MGGQIPFDADSAADRVEAEQQDDEGNVLAKDGVVENGQGEAVIQTRLVSPNGLVPPRPMGRDGSFVEAQVVGEGQQAKDGCDKEAILVILPPVLCPRHERENGNRSQEQGEGNNRPNRRRRDGPGSTSLRSAGRCCALASHYLMGGMTSLATMGVIRGGQRSFFRVLVVGLVLVSRFIGPLAMSIVRSMVMLGIVAIVLVSLIFGAVAMIGLLMRGAVVAFATMAAAGLLRPLLGQTESDQDEVEDDHSENREDHRFV